MRIAGDFPSDARLRLTFFDKVCPMLGKALCRALEVGTFSPFLAGIGKNNGVGFGIGYDETHISFCSARSWTYENGLGGTAFLLGNTQGCDLHGGVPVCRKGERRVFLLHGSLEFACTLTGLINPNGCFWLVLRTNHHSNEDKQRSDGNGWDCFAQGASPSLELQHPANFVPLLTRNQRHKEPDVTLSLTGLFHYRSDASAYYRGAIRR